MTVVVISQVGGLTLARYNALRMQVANRLRAASGFSARAMYEGDSGFCVIELWASKSAADRFFAQQVAPEPPKDVHPKRYTHVRHSLVQP